MFAASRARRRLCSNQSGTKIAACLSATDKPFFTEDRFHGSKQVGFGHCFDNVASTPKLRASCITSFGVGDKLVDPSSGFDPMSLWQSDVQRNQILLQFLRFPNRFQSIRCFDHDLQLLFLGRSAELNPLPVQSLGGDRSSFKPSLAVPTILKPRKSQALADGKQWKNHQRRNRTLFSEGGSFMCTASIKTSSRFRPPGH